MPSETVDPLFVGALLEFIWGWTLPARPLIFLFDRLPRFQCSSYTDNAVLPASRSTCIEGISRIANGSPDWFPIARRLGCKWDFHKHCILQIEIAQGPYPRFPRIRDMPLVPVEMGFGAWPPARFTRKYMPKGARRSDAEFRASSASNALVVGQRLNIPIPKQVNRE